MSGAVREVRSGELEELLELYTHLHEKGTPLCGKSCWQTPVTISLWRSGTGACVPRVHWWWSRI